MNGGRAPVRSRSATACGPARPSSVLGSGTTLIAAEQTGRTAYLLELDPKYADVIVERWQSFTGEQAVLEKTGVTPIPLKTKPEGEEA